MSHCSGAFRRVIGGPSFHRDLLYEKNDRVHLTGVFKLRRMASLTLYECVMFLFLVRGVRSFYGRGGRSLSPMISPDSFRTWDIFFLHLRLQPTTFCAPIESSFHYHHGHHRRS